MRFVLPLLAPLLAAATVPAEPLPSLGDELRNFEQLRKNCRGRIEQVREERGLPKLQQDTASPDEPLLIAAVEKLVDGCSVMVMYHDTNDIRPLPEFQEGSGQLMPAR